MNRPARFRSADISRALKVVQKEGIAVEAVEIAPDGKISIIARHGSERSDSFEGFFARKEAGRRA